MRQAVRLCCAVCLLLFAALFASCPESGLGSSSKEKAEIMATPAEAMPRGWPLKELTMPPASKLIPVYAKDVSRRQQGKSYYWDDIEAPKGRIHVMSFDTPLKFEDIDAHVKQCLADYDIRVLQDKDESKDHRFREYSLVGTEYTLKLSYNHWPKSETHEEFTGYTYVLTRHDK